MSSSSMASLRAAFYLKILLHFRARNVIWKTSGLFLSIALFIGS